MMPYCGERRFGFLLQAPRVLRPIVVKIQRSAVVDEVRSLVPKEQVRIPRGAIDVGDKRVEPDRFRGYARIGLVSGGWIEHRGAGQVVEREVYAHTRL